MFITRWEAKTLPTQSYEVGNNYKDISGFIEYWKELCKEEITKIVHDLNELLIAYWNCIQFALRLEDFNTRSTWTQGLWLQSRMTTLEFDTMFFRSENVHCS